MALPSVDRWGRWLGGKGVGQGGWAWFDSACSESLLANGATFELSDAKQRYNTGYDKEHRAYDETAIDDRSSMPSRSEPTRRSSLERIRRAFALVSASSQPKLPSSPPLHRLAPA